MSDNKFIFPHIALPLGTVDEKEKYVKKITEEWNKVMSEIKEEESRLIRPPIGIPPRHIIDAKRLQEIDNAIVRYVNHSEHIKIPIEWIEERNEIINRLERRKK